jgi:hypothetical protein
LIATCRGMRACAMGADDGDVLDRRL